MPCKIIQNERGSYLTIPDHTKQYRTTEYHISAWQSSTITILLPKILWCLKMLRRPFVNANIEFLWKLSKLAKSGIFWNVIHIFYKVEFITNNFFPQDWWSHMDTQSINICTCIHKILFHWAAYTIEDVLASTTLSEPPKMLVLRNFLGYLNFGKTHF